MRSLFLVLAAAGVLSIFVAAGQSGTASITGTVVDAKTNRPIVAALVAAIRDELPSLRTSARSGGDGAFRIEALPAGTYWLCVQTENATYLDPCEWDGSPTGILLASGRTAAGVALKLTAASIVDIQLKDPSNLLKRKTKEGRSPDVAVGVWGANGLYHPARAVGDPISGASPQTAVNLNIVYGYQIAVPRDTPLKLHLASKDLKLGDSLGTALPGNTSEQAFQHTGADANRSSFSFTVMGTLP